MIYVYRERERDREHYHRPESGVALGPHEVGEIPGGVEPVGVVDPEALLEGDDRALPVVAPVGFGVLVPALGLLGEVEERLHGAEHLPT